MKVNHKQWVEGLILNQGYDEALRIVKKCYEGSKKASSAAQLTMVGEADYHINTHGVPVLSKIQTDKTAKVKDKRIKANLNFYYTALNLMKACAP